MKKKIHYNYMRPQNYYNRLFTFFIFIGLTLTIFLLNFLGRDFTFEIFLVHFIVLVFLLLCFAVIIEYFYLGEYMSPHERLDIMHFVTKLLDDYSNGNEIDSYVSRYNHKTFSFLKTTLYNKKNRFVVSTLRKVDSHIIVTLLDERRVFTYFFFKFFSKKAVITLQIARYGGKFKVIRAR